MHRCGIRKDTRHIHRVRTTTTTRRLTPKECFCQVPSGRTLAGVHVNGWCSSVRCVWSWPQWSTTRTGAPRGLTTATRTRAEECETYSAPRASSARSHHRHAVLHAGRRERAGEGRGRPVWSSRGGRERNRRAALGRAASRPSSLCRSSMPQCRSRGKEVVEVAKIESHSLLDVEIWILLCEPFVLAVCCTVSWCSSVRQQMQFTRQFGGLGACAPGTWQSLFGVCLA